MNAVRKHLCDMKGGRFVEYANPATVHTFTLNTATPEMLWPDLSNPDPTTFEEAIDVLETYNIWNKMPVSVKNHLLEGRQNINMETPKVLTNMNNYIHYVADPNTACEAMAHKAKSLGYSPHILGTSIEGEASSLGIFLAGIANEISKNNRPFSSPCALISGGETTVTIANENTGIGGPNQETVLGFLTKLYATNQCVCISIDSDGTDGPTEIAGGIVDNTSIQTAKKMEINIDQTLIKHNASDALNDLKSAIKTGHTGTNIMNLRIVLITREINK